jgi:hypothetical protein
MRISTLAVAALIALVAPSAVHAQRLADVKSGTLMRVETIDSDVFIGPLLGMGPDSVRIKTPGDPPVALQLRKVRTFAIGGGQNRGLGAWQGAKLGGGLGLVVWALAKAAGKSYGEDLGKFGTTFAITSTVLGVGIGTAMAPQRWIPVQP